MRILDRQGRVFGTINVIDLLSLLLVLSLVPMAFFVSSLVAGRWRLEVLGVNQRAVIPGIDGTLIIEGRGFDMWSKVQFGDRKYLPARFMKDHGHLMVDIPVDLPPGDYDVSVLDRRRHIAVLPKAFKAIGRPPRLPVEVDVVCLFTGVSMAEVAQLEASIGSTTENPCVRVIYGSFISSPEKKRDAEGWALVGVRLNSMRDETRNGLVYFMYADRELAPGVTIGLELAGVRVNGFVASLPQLVRYTPWTPGAEVE